MSQPNHKRDWDDLAHLDPLWAIASTPGREGWGWDDEAFMASGQRKVDRIVRWLDALGAPAVRGRALEFGCGIGRVTIPLAGRFDEVVGVDISSGMVEQARARAAAIGLDNIEFVVNERADLSALGDRRFDLVFTAQVLQHLPSRAHIARYTRDLAALVAPGGVLIVQVPSDIGLHDRLQWRRRAYRALRSVGVPRRLLYERLRLNPIRMISFPRKELESLLTEGGLRIASVSAKRRGSIVSQTYKAVRPAS